MQLVTSMSECKQMHFNRKAMGRADGSALQKASYRAAVPLYDERLDMTFHYRNNENHIGLSKIFAPIGAPEKLLDREGLWNAAEAAERKKNSVYAQEFNAGLPHQLTHQQQEDLIADFIQNHYVKMGIICDVNVHLKPTNNHFHCMMTTRHIDHSTDSLFAKGKSRDWWKIGSVQRDRVAFCDYINKHLEMAGSSVRYSHKTLEAQGIDRKPQIHVGPQAKAMDERGVHSDRVQINNNIINFNKAAAKVKAAKAALEKVKKKRLEKKKEEQEQSAKQNRMIQSQREYLALHREVSDGWSKRQDWFHLKPNKPILDTIEGSKHERNVGLWKQAGQAIRDVIKGTIKAIRCLADDYSREYDRNLPDDAIELIESGEDLHGINETKINGP